MDLQKRNQELEEQITLMAGRIGELVLENEVLKQNACGCRSFADLQLENFKAANSALNLRRSSSSEDRRMVELGLCHTQ